MQERGLYAMQDDGLSVGHPDLEELAALQDGLLSAEEASRLRAHLAHCEPCLALFAETASFLAADREVEAAGEAPTAAPDSTVLTFPSPKSPEPIEAPPRRWKPRRWAASAAAAIVAAGGLALATLMQGPPQVAVDPFLASIAGHQGAIAGALEGHNVRSKSGGPGNFLFASFQLGVELVDLDASLAAAGATESAKAAATHVNGLLEKDVSPGPKVKAFYRALPSRLDAGLSPDLAAEMKAMHEDLEGYLQKADYDFGRWSELGRLAAAAHAPEFFEARDTRRFPDGLERRLDRKLVPRAAAAVDEIRKILDRRGQLTAADYPRLEARFGEILEIYYPR